MLYWLHKNLLPEYRQFIPRHSFNTEFQLIERIREYEQLRKDLTINRNQRTHDNYFDRNRNENFETNNHNYYNRNFNRNNFETQNHDKLYLNHNKML